MRVASAEDALSGKIKTWRDADKRQSKRLKDLGDIARLVASRPHLWELLDPDLKAIIQKQQAEMPGCLEPLNLSNISSNK
jgi:hypothetical protein